MTNEKRERTIAGGYKKPVAVSSPKILHLDIETKPATAYVWRGFKENVSPEQVIKPDGIICWAAKWHGKNGMKFSAEWKDLDFLKPLWNLINEADAVVTYNGDKFDLPKIKGALVRSGLPPLPPVTSIDLYKSVRRLGYFSGKLAFVAPLLGLGTKVKHHGFGLWKDVIDGKPEAQALMEKYNKQDVKLLEDLYCTLLPYLDKHPHLTGGPSCPNCGSLAIHHRGYRRTRTSRVERLHCTGCGAWHTGKRSKV